MCVLGPRISGRTEALDQQFECEKARTRTVLNV